VHELKVKAKKERDES